MLINEKCEKDAVVLQDTFSKTRITTRMTSVDKLTNNIDSWQKNSLNKKTDSSTILEIIDKNDTKYKLMCENSDY